MKKIFTLLLGTMLTLVVFADHRPSVTLKSNRKYEVVIDGKSYYNYNGNTMNIANLGGGKHTVRVFEINRSVFRTTRRLVSTSGFRLRNQDVTIFVDPRGTLRIIESKEGKDFGRDNRRDNDWGHDRDHDNGRRDRDGRF